MCVAWSKISPHSSSGNRRSLVWIWAPPINYFRRDRCGNKVRVEPLVVLWPTCACSTGPEGSSTRESLLTGPLVTACGIALRWRLGAGAMNGVVRWGDKGFQLAQTAPWQPPYRTRPPFSGSSLSSPGIGLLMWTCS